MAVHLLFRPAPAAPPPTPVSPVRRSARLGPHPPTPPSGPSTPPTNPAAFTSAKQRAAKGHPSPIPNTRKRARPSETQPLLHVQSDESDSETPAAAVTALVPPLTPGPTPRSIRAQKRQKVSSTTDAGQAPPDKDPTTSSQSLVATIVPKTRAAKRKSLVIDEEPPLVQDMGDPATSSLTPLAPATVPKTRAAKRKSLVVDDGGQPKTLLQEPPAVSTTRAPKRKRNENAPQPASLVRSAVNGRKTKLKATPRTMTARGRAPPQVQLTGDNNVGFLFHSMIEFESLIFNGMQPPHVGSAKGKERAREDDIPSNPRVVSLRLPRRSALNPADLVASTASSSLSPSHIVHGLNSKDDLSSPLPHSIDIPRTTRTTRAKARELLSLENNDSRTTQALATSALTAPTSPRLGPLGQTMGIVLNTNVLSLGLNQASAIAGSKPGNSSTSSQTETSQTTKSTGRPQPHIHFHSPLTPLAHTTSTTPPGSPTLSARVSPPLDAIDLGLVLGGGGEGSGSSTSTNNSPVSSPNTSATAATPSSSPSSSSVVKTNTIASDLSPAAASISGGLFPNPIMLPTIPTAAAAFLGAQEMPEQQRCIQPYNFPLTSPTEELGAPPPSPAAHMQTHPLSSSLSSSSSTSAPVVMNISREILDVGFQEASVDIGAISINVPLNVSSIPASESELGFGFHPQEGFSNSAGMPSLGSSSSSSEQPHQHTGQEQSEQRIYAQDATAEQFQCPPGYEERQSVQQPEAQQVQHHHTTPLSLKQQRKLTYPDPLPLEHAPRIERDGSLWKTACKLRVFEL